MDDEDEQAGEQDEERAPYPGPNDSPPIPDGGLHEQRDRGICGKER